MKTMHSYWLIALTAALTILQNHDLKALSIKNAPTTAQGVIRILPLLYYGQFFGLDELFPGVKKAQIDLSAKDLDINDNSFSFAGSSVTINGLNFTIDQPTVVPAKGGFFTLTPSKEGISFEFTKQ